MTKLETLQAEQKKIIVEIDDILDKINKSEDVAERVSLTKDLDAKIKSNNDYARDIYVEDAITSGNSETIMMKCLRNPTYDTLRTSEDDDTGSIETVKAAKFIDFTYLHKKAKGGIGKDATWVHVARKFNFLMAIRTFVGISGNKEALEEMIGNYSANMKDVVKGITFEASEDPSNDPGTKPDKFIVSNKTVLNAMKKTITAMIGEEYAKKLISYHVRYLIMAYTQHDRKVVGGGLKTLNDKQFIRVLTDVCLNVMTDGEFKLNIPGAKAKK